MVTTFEVLSEPTRRRILDLLRAQERPVGDLVDAIGMSQPAVSKHLRVLRQAALVEFRTDAQRRVYRVRPEPLLDVDRWLAPYRELWATRPESSTIGPPPERERVHGSPDEGHGDRGVNRSRAVPPPRA